MDDRLSCVDLFCGAGGFSLGFQDAGYEILCGTDKYESALRTYRSNIKSPAIEADARDLEAEYLMEQSGFDPSDVDVVIGGPPCKGFSLAGQFNAGDPRNELFNHYISIVKELDPRAVVMENVPGILTIKNGEFVKRILEQTRSMGYNIQHLRMNAADYGVPQLRERIIFIGYKKSVAPSRVSRPPQTHSGGQMRLSSFCYGNSLPADPYVTNADAISDLAFLEPGTESDQYIEEAKTPYQQRMRGSQDKLYNHVAPQHSQEIQVRFGKLNPGQKMKDLKEQFQTKKHSMKKMRPDLPSNTITTLPEDFVHYSQDRIPTVRELARIQSFPDWFEFKGPRTTGGKRRRREVPQYSQVGNAVPPLLSEAIGKQVQRALENS